MEWRKYTRINEGAFKFVPLAQETFGRAGSAAYRFLNRSLRHRSFLCHAMQNLSATLCRNVAGQMCASVPFLGRFAGKPSFPGLSVPSDSLVSLACHAGPVFFFLWALALKQGFYF